MYTTFVCSKYIIKYKPSNVHLRLQRSKTRRSETRRVFWTRTALTNAGRRSARRLHLLPPLPPPLLPLPPPLPLENRAALVRGRSPVGPGPIRCQTLPERAALNEVSTGQNTTRMIRISGGWRANRNAYGCAVTSRRIWILWVFSSLSAYLCSFLFFSSFAIVIHCPGHIVSCYLFMHCY